MEFSLEKWDISFAENIAKHADNNKIAANLRNAFPNPYTYDDAKWYVNHCIQNEGDTILCRAIIVGGEAVGSVGIFFKDDVYCKSAEVGYWLGEPFWDMGIMSSAVRQICHMAFQTHDIVRIFAEPFASNKGSRRVLEKAGFTLEGIMKNSVFKNGMILDSCIYALTK